MSTDGKLLKNWWKREYDLLTESEYETLVREHDQNCSLKH